MTSAEKNSKSNTCEGTLPNSGTSKVLRVTIDNISVDNINVDDINGDIISPSAQCMPC